MWKHSKGTGIVHSQAERGEEVGLLNVEGGDGTITRSTEI